MPLKFQRSVRSSGKNSRVSIKSSLKHFVLPLFFFIALTTLILLLILRILSKQSQKARQKLKTDLEYKINNYIENNSKSNISLEDYCNVYGLSLRQTQRILKEDLHSTFNGMLTNKRMNQAKFTWSHADMAAFSALVASASTSRSQTVADAKSELTILASSARDIFVSC